jgi:predicted Fe-Mo cluster-binding NifX family protein
MTKIAIPSMSNTGLESEVCAHFGSCEHFTIIEINDGNVTEVKAIGNGSEDGQHNCAAPAMILNSQGVQAVLVSGIGGRPLMSLVEKGIKVYAGAGGNVADAVKDYNEGTLKELSNMGTCNCHHL